MTEPNIYDHETRIALVEQNCERCPDKFKALFAKLDEIQKNIFDLKINEAKSNGLRALLWGTGGGGVVIGIVKAFSYLFGNQRI